MSSLSSYQRTALSSRCLLRQRKCAVAGSHCSIYHPGNRWRQDFQRTVPLPSLPPPNKPSTSPKLSCQGVKPSLFPFKRSLPFLPSGPGCLNFQRAIPLTHPQAAADQDGWLPKANLAKILDRLFNSFQCALQPLLVAAENWWNARKTLPQKRGGGGGTNWQLKLAG